MCAHPQVATILLTIISAVVTFYIESVSGAWKLLMAPAQARAACSWRAGIGGA